MLPYLRAWLGTEPAAAAKARAPAPVVVDHDALLRAQTLQLQQLREEEAEIKTELAEATRAQNRPLIKARLARLHQLGADIRMAEGKRDNLVAQQRLLQAADGNVQQAALMGAGADQLDALVDQAERIDLDDIVDRLQDGAARTHEYSGRLSEPLMGTPSDYGGDYVDLDDEVESLMRRTEDERLAGLLDTPSLSTPSGAGGGGGSGALRTSAKTTTPESIPQ